MKKHTLTDMFGTNLFPETFDVLKRAQELANQYYDYVQSFVPTDVQHQPLSSTEFLKQQD